MLDQDFSAVGLRPVVTTNAWWPKQLPGLGTINLYTWAQVGLETFFIFLFFILKPRVN